MKLTAKLLFVVVLLMLPAMASAQQDPFGAVDTIWAEVSKVDDLNW